MAHSDEGMVRSGLVREMDRVGNDCAYEAAGFQREGWIERVIDARRHVSGNCGVCIPEFGICIGSSLPLLQELL